MCEPTHSRRELKWRMVRQQEPAWIKAEKCVDFSRRFCFLRTYLKRCWSTATVDSRDIPQAVGGGSLKTHVLSVCVDFSFPSGGAARWQNFPTHSSMHLPACLPACPLLPRCGLLELPGHWASQVGLQNRAGIRLGTEKHGCNDQGCRNKQLNLLCEVRSKVTLGAQGHRSCGRAAALWKGQGWLWFMQVDIKGKQ